MDSLNHFARILFFLLFIPIVSYSQSLDDCKPLENGTFIAYEDGKEKGLFYRKDNIQIEPTTEGKFLYSRIKNLGNCDFDVKSLYVKEDVDTITFSIKYQKPITGMIQAETKPRYVQSRFIYKTQILKVSDEIHRDILKLFSKIE